MTGAASLVLVGSSAGSGACKSSVGNAGGVVVVATDAAGGVCSLVPSAGALIAGSAPSGGVYSPVLLVAVSVVVGEGFVLFFVAGRSADSFAATGGVISAGALEVLVVEVLVAADGVAVALGAEGAAGAEGGLGAPGIGGSAKLGGVEGVSAKTARAIAAPIRVANPKIPAAFELLFIMNRWYRTCRLLHEK